MRIIFCLAPITEIALGQLPVIAVPNATGLYTLMRSLGGASGIALINILVGQRVSLHYHRLAESLNPDAFDEYLGELTSMFSSRPTEMEQTATGVKLIADWSAGKRR